MQIKLQFLGAAQNVTGSRHLLEANGVRLLVDCGLYQERQFRDRNFEKFTADPESLDAVLLTHAHLDHSGLLPKLVKEGFKGRIYCTGATAEIAKIILFDSAKLQVEDIAYKRKRHQKQGKLGPYPYKPLYTIEDVEATLPLFCPVEYRESFDLGNGVEATLYDAGHVLGSSIIRVKVRQEGQERIIIFSGDIGRPGRPIICDPTVFDKADYVLIESTYGDRVHSNGNDVKNAIAEVINSTIKMGGNIVIPSFALERSQETLFYINELICEKAIPRIKVFLDSPMASKITEVFKHHTDLFDKETTELVNNHHSPFNFPDLQFTGTANESKAINDINEPIIVIAGSGMCTGGRIKHHLVNNISRPQSTIMFIGYQAIGTLGRLITDGKNPIRILGNRYDVKARIARINGFSAHADRNELVEWLTNLKAPPRKVFIVHGEENSAKTLGKYLRKITGWSVDVPEYKQEVLLD